MSRAQEIIDSGNPAAIIAMALNAAFSDERCQCETPSLVEYDLMCGNCLLGNESQIEKAIRRIREPHPFETKDGLPDFCAICVRLADDPRHTGAPTDE